MKHLILLLFACLVPSTYSHTLFEAHVELKPGHLSHPSPLGNISSSDENPEITFPIPSGTPHGSLYPTVPQAIVIPFNASTPSISKRSGCSKAGTTFIKQPSTWGKHSNFFPPDTSGAPNDNGKVVFATSNTFASFSINGITFSNLEATRFSGPPKPPIHNGLWGDQVVIYIPKIDCFAWLMQYRPTTSNVNMLRIVIFRPKDVDKNGIKPGKWSHIDLPSSTFKLGNNWMDYPDLSFGDKFLYVSVDKVGFGLFIIRIPLSALKRNGPFTLQYTPPFQDAYGAHLSQNAGDAVFWAGQPTTSALRVYRILENTNFWSSSDVDINSYLTGDYKSVCPDGQNWLSFGFPRAAVIGATRRTHDEVWFAWSAARGGGFLQPYIPVAQINTSKWPNLSVNRQWEIWNPNFAFAYPALTTNECGDVGIALAWGGNQSFASSAVGIADAKTGILGSTVYYASLSTQCNDRWGDYLTVRTASPDEHGFAAFIYSVVNSDFVRQYVLFGR